MPEALHRKLRQQALKKFGTLDSEEAQRYIYGALENYKKKQKKKK